MYVVPVDDFLPSEEVYLLKFLKLFTTISRNMYRNLGKNNLTRFSHRSMPNVLHSEAYPDAFWGLMLAYFTIVILILYFCVRNFYCMRRHSIQPDNLYNATTVIVRHPDRERCHNSLYSQTQLIAIFS